MVKKSKFSFVGNSSQRGRCSVASLFDRFSFALLSDSVNNVLLIILNIRILFRILLRSTFFNIIVGKLRARLKERRKQRASHIFFVSLSLFPGAKGCSPLSWCAWSLSAQKSDPISSNHGKAQVVWYPRLSEVQFLIIIAERAPREERGNLHPPSHQIVLLLKSEFRERDTKKSKPRVFFFGSAQFLSSRDTTLRILSHIFLLIIADLFVLRARLASRKRIRSRERKKERKKDQKSKKKIKMTNRFS